MTRRHRLTRRGRRLLVVTGFAIFVAAIAGIVLTYTWHGGDRDPQPPTAPGEVRRVQIPPQLAAQDVAKILEREGIIGSTSGFLLQVRLEGADDSLRPGAYDFRVGQEYGEIIAQLQQGGASSTVKLTIPEGLSVDQTGERLDSGKTIKGSDYLELAAAPARFQLPSVGGEQPDVTDLEGLLFPSTYFLGEDDGAAELIRLQLEAFASKTAALPWANTKNLGVSPYQVVVVASLIEKEARVAEERPRVAAVIYNRMKKKMPLGIDATVRFALKKWTGALTKSDLEVDSPYNTRRYEGLPPGPIASPGLAALKAALEPEKVDFLYYVLIDEAGHHFFTSSYAEFLEAKERAPGD
ncbi:MAG: endolytic transglycosylase MltG [Thermoleophilia bacterium]|nr:endolytic transglycosylase MltG [Thermoleophilia bacterium]